MPHPAEPIDLAILSEPVATVSQSGTRTPVDPDLVIPFPPRRIASVLREANDGYGPRYVSMAEMLELRDAHYRSVVQTRRLAVSQLGFTIKPASEAPRDVEIAEFVRDALSTEAFEQARADVLDAISKGYSVVEIFWETGARFVPDRFVWRDPRHFRFDRDTLSKIRLATPAVPYSGAELPTAKFICHTPQTKSGIPIRGGLAWTAAALHLLKSYAIKDWAAFADVFGIPIRVAKYSEGTTAADVDEMKAALRAIGSNAAAVIKDTIDLEIMQASAQAGAGEFFEGWANWLNKEISKLVLGQTMTVEDGSSLAQASVHADVREDIRNADAAAMWRTLNRDVVRYVVDLNFGPQDRYPQGVADTAAPEDLASLSSALAPLLAHGLAVSADEIRGRFGLRRPEPGEETIGGSVESGGSLPFPAE